MTPIILILDNVRSAHNVGSIFRTADAVGVEKIFCIGTTPTPTDRFGRKRKDIAKVALGAEDAVAWEHVDMNKVQQLVTQLKKRRYTVVALEQDVGAVDYRTLENTAIALIVGNEVGGVSKDLIRVADVITEIPMRGKKESLNVSVALGIALFSFRR